MTEPATSLNRIRAAIEGWRAQWQPWNAATGPAVADLAARIDTALFGPAPGPWVGPMLTADEWAEIQSHDLWTEEEQAAIAGHIAAAWATIRNQNAELVAHRENLERLRAEMRKALYVTALREVMGAGVMAQDVPLLAEMLGDG